MKRISLFILLALLGLLFAPCEASAKKKSYFIADYDVTMDVEENGDVRVSETVGYAFTRGTFTYALSHHSHHRIRGDRLHLDDQPRWSFEAHPR